MRRFDPSELRSPDASDPSPAEQADALLAARELEALAAGPTVRPSGDFEDRVMAAIALEPAPRLAVRPPSAVRGGLVASFLMSIRDSWRVATSSGRPVAIRAQALAFVLLVALAATALAGVGAAGVGGLLDRKTPAPSVQPGLTAEPTPSGPAESAEPTPSDGKGASESPRSTRSADPTETSEPTGTAAPAATAEPTETGHAETPRPTRTPRPTDTAEPDDTPTPSETPKGSDDPGGGGSGSGGDSNPG